MCIPYGSFPIATCVSGSSLCRYLKLNMSNASNAFIVDLTYLKFFAVVLQEFHFGPHHMSANSDYQRKVLYLCPFCHYI